MASDGEGWPDDLPMDRRALLKYAGGAGLVGTTAVGGAQLLTGDDAGGSDGGSGTGTVAPPANADELAQRFAPDLHFGKYEKWFPTDPRRYLDADGDGGGDGAAAVDGFTALDQYTREFEQSGDPPAPTTLYNVVGVTDSLVAVQYWFYSVFDQFSVNFHWHDWELLQVFVDRETDEPVLVSASSHSRKVPNNEFLSPDLDDDRPAILSEVGSHSSATSFNQRETHFSRDPTDDLAADITNATVDVAEFVGQRLAYGLPRDEGLALPYAMPELDGQPLYEHPDLPNVERQHFVADELTVRSLQDLAAPPESLPKRETGLTFVREGRDGGDYEYELLPASAVTTEIDEFTGPQLSFEFAVPTFVEDQFANHITTVSTPWEQPRYEDPVADVTGPNHLNALAEQYGIGANDVGNVVMGAVSEVTEGATGELRDGVESTEEIADYVDVSITDASVESICLLESDPTAVPTTNGVVSLVGVEPGEHRLTVNGAGYAPHAERLQVAADDSPTALGVGGNVSLVRNEDAVKLKGDATETEAGLASVRVTDDFAGPLYESAPVGDEDRFGVYVHRKGTYSAEYTDREGTPGAARLDPGDDEEVTLSDLRTGKGPLSSYLDDYLGDAAGLARGLGATGKGNGKGKQSKSVAERFSAAADRSAEAADSAGKGNPGRADRALEATRNRLQGVLSRIEARKGDEIPESVAAVLSQRAQHADEKAKQAIDAGKGE
jgi:hypothetical protein